MQTRCCPRFVLWLGLLFALVGAPRGASADRQQALESWKKGETAYSLGRFQEAIGHFERAYLAHPSPAFTFNIAQCHRQLKNCESAAFFYRRYLSMKPDANNRREVERFIAEMEAMCAKAREGGQDRAEEDDSGGDDPRPEPRARRDVPPPEVETESPDSRATASTESQAAAPPAADESPILTTVAEVGPAFVDMGDVKVPTRPSVRLGVAHPFGFGTAGVEPGVLATVTPILVDGGSTAWLTSLLASAAGTYQLAARWRLRAEAGVGVLIFSGLDEGNPFTEGRRATTGPLGMFNLRTAVGADFVVSDSLVVSATPLAFAVSPAKQGLDSSIDTITRLDVLIGLGYRL
jgi:hypothetical protein